MWSECQEGNYSPLLQIIFIFRAFFYFSANLQIVKEEGTVNVNRQDGKEKYFDSFLVPCQCFSYFAAAVA